MNILLNNIYLFFNFKNGLSIKTARLINLFNIAYLLYFCKIIFKEYYPYYNNLYILIIQKLDICLFFLIH